MKSNNPHKILFSTYQLDKSLEYNQRSLMEVFLNLQDFGVSCDIVQGMYKGTKEESILVVLPQFQSESYDNQIKMIESIVLKYNQESYLYIHNDGVSELRYFGNTSNNVRMRSFAEKLGQFTEVESIDGLDAYTIYKDRAYTII